MLQDNKENQNTPTSVTNPVASPPVTPVPSNGAAHTNNPQLVFGILLAIVILSVLTVAAYFYLLTPKQPMPLVSTPTATPMNYFGQPTAVPQPESTGSGLPTMTSGHSVSDIQSDLDGVDLGSSNADIQNLKNDASGL